MHLYFKLVKSYRRVGFLHVIDMLSSEKKLTVDIAHEYSKFFRPLPVAVEDFASSIHKHFPYIINTKIRLNYSDILRHLMKWSGTSLSSAFSVLRPHIASSVKSSALVSTFRVKVEVQVDDLKFCFTPYLANKIVELSSSWNSGAKHEVGYDAFMTGCVFSQVCADLSIDFEQQSPPTELANNAMHQKYMNLLYLSWTNGDFINMSTGNRTPVSLGHYIKRWYSEIIFHCFAVGASSKTEVREAVSKVFGHHSVITIYHLDQTAASIQWETHASGYEVYKEICGSSMSQVLYVNRQMRAIEEKSDAIYDHSCGNSSCDEVFDSLSASSGSRF
ncbi:Ribonuclease CAF1, partial [Dillenia turbinata]